MEGVLYKKEEKPEIDRFVELIKNMDEGTQKRILIFMQGVHFAENTHKEAALCS